MKVNFTQHGDFNKFEKFLTKVVRIRPVTDAILRKYAARGLETLRALTPKDTTKTANSWSYELKHENGVHSIVWRNSNIKDGHIIALLLQYGHGTKNGTYVEGNDFVNPAIAAIFDDMADELWKEVSS